MPEIFNIFKLAEEIHFHGGGDTVYGDSRFIGLFPRTAISSELVLKTKCDVTDVMTGESWENTDRIPLRMKERTGMVAITKATTHSPLTPHKVLSKVL